MGREEGLCPAAWRLRRRVCLLHVRIRAFPPKRCRSRNSAQKVAAGIARPARLSHALPFTTHPTSSAVLLSPVEAYILKVPKSPSPPPCGGPPSGIKERRACPPLSPPSRFATIAVSFL